MARSNRRDLILEEAVRLFREQGYAATGIDDIGGAAGISGPGVYRHFASKQDILAEAIRDGTDHLLTDARVILEQSANAAELIEALTENLVTAVVEHPNLVAVLMQEEHNLDPRARRARNKAYGVYLDDWVEVLIELRPDLSDAEARTAVHVVVGMVVAVARYSSGVESERLARLLRNMIIGALLAEHG
ncbi:MAG: TetR/AcrR family transcriptional regulator [Acidimicrobiia bacterium]